MTSKIVGNWSWEKSQGSNFVCSLLYYTLQHLQHQFQAAKLCSTSLPFCLLTYLTGVQALSLEPFRNWRFSLRLVVRWMGVRSWEEMLYLLLLSHFSTVLKEWTGSNGRDQSSFGISGRAFLLHGVQTQVSELALCAEGEGIHDWVVLGVPEGLKCLAAIQQMFGECLCPVSTLASTKKGFLADFQVIDKDVNNSITCVL